MIRIRFKTSLAGVNYAYGKGDEVDWRDEAEAKRLIEAGFAEPVGRGPKVETAAIDHGGETAAQGDGKGRRGRRGKAGNSE